MIDPAERLAGDVSPPRVVVIIPAYNEELRIERVIQTVPACVAQIVVIDDASHDQTAARARSCARTHVISHAVNRGVGAALQTGYAYAMTQTEGDRDAFVVMAGDGQMDPDDLPRLIEPIHRGDADYVKGDRFGARDIRHVMPLGRRIGGQFFSFWTARAIGQAISDSQCGYTALARSACAQLDLERLWPGYGYPNDLLGQIAARSMRIAEVSVRPVYAGEKSGLKLRHLPAIAALIGRAWVRRKRSLTL